MGLEFTRFLSGNAGKVVEQYNTPPQGHICIPYLTYGTTYVPTQLISAHTTYQLHRIPNTSVHNCGYIAYNHGAIVKLTEDKFKELSKEEKNYSDHGILEVARLT